MSGSRLLILSVMIAGHALPATVRAQEEEVLLRYRYREGEVRRMRFGRTEAAWLESPPPSRKKERVEGAPGPSRGIAGMDRRREA